MLLSSSDVQTAMHVFIDFDDRPQTATADTSHGFQREALIGRSLTVMTCN